MITPTDSREVIHHQIVDAARFHFQDKGFDNTTVSDLIESLHITEQTFLKYFQSMDDLLEVVWAG